MPYASLIAGDVARTGAPSQCIGAHRPATPWLVGLTRSSRDSRDDFRTPVPPADRSTADVPALHRLWTDARVRRFLWDGKVVPLECTAEIVEKNTRLFEACGFGIWGVRARNATELVGFTGYWHFHTPPSLELLFGGTADHWHRGIATESSRCVMHYGFEALDFRTIEASTDVANAASVRVLEKLGMSFRQRAVRDGLDAVFYALRRDDWWEANQPSIAPVRK
jgi:RimJ/RimL family protein N-acetyltransferase